MTNATYNLELTFNLTKEEFEKACPKFERIIEYYLSAGSWIGQFFTQKSYLQFG